MHIFSIILSDLSDAPRRARAIKLLHFNRIYKILICLKVLNPRTITLGYMVVSWREIIWCWDVMNFHGAAAESVLERILAKVRAKTHTRTLSHSRPTWQFENRLNQFLSSPLLPQAEEMGWVREIGQEWEMRNWIQKYIRIVCYFAVSILRADTKERRTESVHANSVNFLLTTLHLYLPYRCLMKLGFHLASSLSLFHHSHFTMIFIGCAPTSHCVQKSKQQLSPEQLSISAQNYFHNIVFFTFQPWEWDWIKHNLALVVWGGGMKTFKIRQRESCCCYMKNCSICFECVKCKTDISRDGIEIASVNLSNRERRTLSSH